jgi:predicted  nucleic acid-binding Zn ribbon protein
MNNVIHRDASSAIPPRGSDEETEVRQCPRCGRSTARVIGRSDTMPVVYLRCDACQLTSVAGV